MQVEITSKHGTIRDDVQTYIRRKAEKLLTYFERVTQINVTVLFDHKRIKTEILVDAEHKHNFVAHHEGADGEDVQATFDQALHKMEHQIHRYKEKIQDHRRTPAVNEVVEPEE